MDGPTVEQRKWIEDMESLTAHPAWTTFMEDLQGNVDALTKSWRTHKTPDTYNYDRGRADALEQVIGLDKFVQQVKDSFAAATVTHAEEQYDADNV